ncbi:hypothetical protein Cycma_2664 [Cyclobacterium marinum DSM 745]|uniref:Uncharacterized protein n=1 Tax=Cyclobacterium marinum (strain ATCC 25205 / DSM 745 / LMG 13164 / NCIMB 1802) TaxID=880070 RepID=G0IYI0_CYCMS|nr:hypothetical protein Cycma_2664 [Cyclobacterium marinum DSM 745]
MVENFTMAFLMFTISTHNIKIEPILSVKTH